MKINLSVLPYLALLALLSVTFSVTAAQQDEEPRRIISVGGGLTEIIYALGASDYLVGVDTTSLWPEEATNLPQVGYQFRLSAEGMLSLRPSIIMVMAGAGPKNVLDKISRTGVSVITFSRDFTVKGVIKNIREVAKVLNRVERGETLISTIEADLVVVKKRLLSNVSRPSVAFIMNLGNGSPVAAGRQTSVDSMLRIAGANNAFSAFLSFKPISKESMIVAAPEVILIARHAARGMPASELQNHRSIAQTPAARNNRVIVVDTLLMLGFGPRIAQAIETLAEQVH